MSFKIPGWHLLDVESYKIIHAESKERFEETVSESEAITNKAVKITTAIVTISAFFLGVATKKISEFTYISTILGIAFIVGSILCLFYCYKLLSKKMGRYRGIDVSKLDYKTITDEENNGYSIQATYSNIIPIILDNINSMIEKNTSRQKDYGFALLYLFISIIIAGIFSGITFQS